MNFRFLITLSTLVFSFWLSACSKGGSPNDGGSGNNPSPTDTIPPVLSVQTPTNNQVFNTGNTINVTGLVTDDLGLYRGSIRIVNDASGLLLKEQLYEIHFFKQYNFSVSQVVNVTVPTDFTITVWFEDHGYNKTTKVVKVKVNP